MIKTSFLFVMSALVFVSCKKEVSVPYGDYQKTISLNGTWQFLAAQEEDEIDLSSTNYSDWDALAVPGNWDTRRSMGTIMLIKSDCRGAPESVFREWGIVDERRNSKVAYDQLKEVYNEWR